MKSAYNTIQGEIIQRYLSGLKGEHVTAEQIIAHFNEDGMPISPSTVYRHLEKLVESGVARKFYLDSISAACYQHVGSQSSYFHLLCEKCGKLDHIECDMLQNVHSHMLEEHGFSVNSRKTVFYGLCKECSLKEGMHGEA